ncbi:MAG: hypothetical protein ACRCTZ_02760 [Sarcina sp.]
MKYNEILKVNENFQYSINLQYDLENVEKFKGYIPTRQALSILDEYMKNILSDTTNKATVLIGPYGKGKSHLLLVLLNIIGNNELSREEKLEVIEKFKFVDEESYKLAQRILEDNKRFLPIIINNTLDLKQSFLIGINEAIKKNKLADLNINTYYDAVIEIVEMWKVNYPASIKILKKELSKFSMTVDKFIEHMKKYSSDAYEIFKNIYPMVCSGMEYNPMVNTDIVKLYEEVNHKLCAEYGFDGIFVVFDEFSKFIEGSIEKNIINELKLLQDFAEMAARSKNNQIHLACITHKSINEYISKVPKTKIDAWRAIEGRFNEIYFTTSAKQSYELISNTIIKDKEKISNVILNDKKIEDGYLEEYNFFKHLFSLEEYNESIKVGCFPMTALATYVLPLISEKVAQNERTLFTFLSTDEKNTFKRFIDIKKIPKLLSVDIIYDYFENLFKKEIFNKNISDIWLKVDSSLKRCETINSKKIMKVLGIIYILGDYEIVPPNMYTLKLALRLDQKNLNKEIEMLTAHNILLLRKSTGFLDFAPMTDYNINEKIDGLVNTKYKNANLAKELQKFINPSYVIPKRYNDEFKMTRYFKTIFLSLNQLKAYYSDDDGLEILVKESKADGIIVNFIYENEMDRLEALKLFKGYLNDRVILKVSNKVFNKRREVLELLAINTLLEQQEVLAEDVLIKEQLMLIKEDIEETLLDYYQQNYLLPNKDLDIYYKDTKISSIQESTFNKEISQVFKELYTNTVIVNNEMINKNSISSQVLKARNNVINIILGENNIEDYRATSAEATIYRATILNKGIDKDNCDSDIKFVLEKINDFILTSEIEKKSLKDLYKILTEVDSKICMRKGIIPIYIAYALKKLKNDIVISLGAKSSKEVDLNYEIINNINETPEDYYITLEKGSNEKNAYIESLENLYSVENEVGNKYKIIFNKMQEWVQGLDKLTRTHVVTKNGIDSQKLIKFRNSLLKYDVNIRSFLFKDLKNIFEVNDYSELFKNITDVKNYLDGYLDDYKTDIIQKTKDRFIKGYKGSLIQAISFWFNNLTDAQRGHLYNNTVNDVIGYFKSIKNESDEVIISNLSLILTGLNIGDWNEKVLESYLDELDTVIKKIEKYEADEEITLSTDSSIKIVLNNEEKTFDVEEVSALGTTILNNIEEVFEDYGSSISDNEKRNILVKILEQYM